MTDSSLTYLQKISAKTIYRMLSRVRFDDASVDYAAAAVFLSIHIVICSKYCVDVSLTWVFCKI